MEKNCKNKSNRVQDRKINKKEVIKFMLDGRDTIVLLTVGLTRKIFFNKMSYFLKQYSHSKKKIKVELDLRNHSTKFDLKNTTDTNTSNLRGQLDFVF